MFHFRVQFTRESCISSVIRTGKIIRGEVEVRIVSREPDDLNVHCVEYLQNRKCNFGPVDHTGWVVVPTINILQAIAPTATRRQSLFWTVRHRLLDPWLFGQPIRGQHWSIEES